MLRRKERVEYLLGRAHGQPVPCVFYSDLDLPSSNLVIEITEQTRNMESKHQRTCEAVSCHSQKINFNASCISLGSRALEITAKFDAPKIRPGRVKFG
jgi:hypothetical protein